MNDDRSAASFLNWPTAITAASLAGGFLALILAAQGNIRWAAGVVVGCGILDSFDGLLARRLSQCSPFGAQLDSLADIVSFGVAPAFMLYMGGLDSIPVAGVLACAGFVLCGAWRLARFSQIGDCTRFLGLPIPPAAVILVGAAAWEAPNGIALAMTFTICALMVCDIPFPTIPTLFRLLRRRRRHADPEAVAVVDVS